MLWNPIIVQWETKTPVSEFSSWYTRYCFILSANERRQSWDVQLYLRILMLWFSIHFVKFYGSFDSEDDNMVRFTVVSCTTSFQMVLSLGCVSVQGVSNYGAWIVVCVWGGGAQFWSIYTVSYDLAVVCRCCPVFVGACLVLLLEHLKTFFENCLFEDHCFSMHSACCPCLDAFIFDGYMYCRWCKVCTCAGTTCLFLKSRTISCYMLKLQLYHIIYNSKRVK